MSLLDNIKDLFSGGSSEKPVGDEVKAVYNPETGNTDNYFGGQRQADGPGHGHIRTTEEGKPTIIRGSYSPGVPNARREATELETRRPEPGDPDYISSEFLFGGGKKKRRR